MGCHFLLQGIFPTWRSSQPRDQIHISLRDSLTTLPPGNPNLNISHVIITVHPWTINGFWIVHVHLYVLCFFSNHSVSSVTQLCPSLCNPMNCSTPGLPVHHQLTEFTQTHAHPVGDAIQPSHSLSSPSPPALNLSQHQGLCKWVSSLHQVVKVLEFQLQNQSYTTLLHSLWLVLSADAEPLKTEESPLRRANWKLLWLLEGWHA